MKQERFLILASQLSPLLVKNIEEEAANHSGLFLFYKLITYIQE